LDLGYPAGYCIRVAGDFQCDRISNFKRIDKGKGPEWGPFLCAGPRQSGVGKGTGMRNYGIAETCIGKFSCGTKVE